MIFVSDKKGGAILGLRLLESRLVVLGTRGWAVLTITGEALELVTVPGVEVIHSLNMLSLHTASVVTWSGRESTATMTLRTIRGVRQ